MYCGKWNLSLFRGLVVFNYTMESEICVFRNSTKENVLAFEPMILERRLAAIGVVSVWEFR